LGKYGVMKSWHQWRTLTARGQIPSAKVGNDIDPCQLSKQGRVIQLPGIANGRMASDRVGIKFQRAVANGLTVCTHSRNVLRCALCHVQQLAAHLRIDSRQPVAG
jgi:hypothetical protein